MRNLLSLSLSLSLLLLTPPSAAAESAAESTAPAPAAFAETDSSYKTISKARYIAGGLLSVFPGFGIGHDVQGRGEEKTGSATKSRLFLQVQTINLLCGAGMLWLEGAEEPDEKTSRQVYRGAAIACFSLFLFARIVEVWDAWNLPSHYKIVGKPFQLNPLVYYDSDKNLSAGLSLKYQF